MNKEEIGAGRVREFFKDSIMQKYLRLNLVYAMPMDEMRITQDVYNRLTVGQLLTLHTMPDDKFATLHFTGFDDETIYLSIAGLSGGMEKDGFINT